MTNNRRVCANIVIVIIIVISVGVVGYFAFVKKSEPIIQQSTFIPTQIDSLVLPAPKTETVDWISFNSVEDVGIRPNFSFKHPSNWIQKGSIDGGGASSILFYEKDKYSQKCEEQVESHTLCYATEQIASILVSLPSMTSAKIEYDSETREAITIDGYHSTKITGTVKSGIKLNTYIGKPGQREMRVIVPNVNIVPFDNIRFEFTMLIESEIDEAAFSEILKTIDFSS